MAASIKNILIALFILSAVAIVTYMLLFLHPSVGDNAKTLRVQFVDIDKVNVGTRVTFAGRPVGEVVAIEEIPNARTNRTSENGEIYVYELTLRVDSSVSMFNTDEILLRTSGLLGERNIEINPRPLKSGEKLQNVEDHVLYAAQTSNVEDTMKQIGELSQKFDLVLDDLHQILDQAKKERIVAKVGHCLDNIGAVTDALNQPEKWKGVLDHIYTVSETLSQRVKPSWAKLDHTLDNLSQMTDHAKSRWVKTVDQTLHHFNQFSQEARHSWKKVDQGLNKLRGAADNVFVFSQKANRLMDNTLKGHGTIGKLFMEEELYLRMKSILHKGEVIMNDINTYGLLFHTNKQWMRLQGHRLRLLERLSHPEDFARYFNKEVDEISSSISHVTLLLNQSACYPYALVDNPCFTRRFGELLRRVGNMEETLKIYNEQVVEPEINASLSPCECER